MKYTPGDLDQRITIMRETNTPDRSGGQVLTLAPLVTIWASVQAKSGGESTNETAVTATAVTMFAIRRRDDIRESDRIVWRGVSYNIRSILLQSAADLFLQIEAERGVGQ